MLEAHWTSYGYCVPNPTTYPWQWLWDSCFHAVAWAHLGDERAVTELGAALSDIDGDGFVRHMRYAPEPRAAADFWGRTATSSITQPPMYGHAVAELSRLGVVVPGELAERATRALRFLLERRARSAGGLVVSVHPWETGCDDSPRWDHWRPDPGLPSWRAVKGDLLATVERSPAGSPIANPAFVSASAGFNALVAFNARELADVTGDDSLRAAADELAEAIDARWDGETWVDDGDAAETSGRVRTVDSLLPALLCGPHARDAVAQLTDPDRFGARFGPRAVSRLEPIYDPRTYWRGPTWPQLTYLSWLALTRTGGPDEPRRSIEESFVAGATTSGWAEYWDPETGEGLGAKPQSWTSLVAAVVSDWRAPRRA